MATRMRLELTTSSVTGWRSNQLNYRAKPFRALHQALPDRCNMIDYTGLYPNCQALF